MLLIQDLAGLVDSEVAAMGQLFRMPVQDAFEIGGEGLAVSGLIVTGQVADGAATVGDILVVVTANGDKRSAQLGAIEMVGKVTDTASSGDDVGLLLAGLKKRDVSTGDVIESQ